MKSISKIRIHFPARLKQIMFVLTAWIGLSLLVGACMSVQTDNEEQAAPVDTGFKFNHAVHFEQGMEDCSMCHDLTVDTPFKLSGPAHELCSICHDIDPAAEDASGCMLCHTREDLSITPAPPVLSGEIKFDHAPHVAAEVECTQCHGDLDGKGFVETPNMSFCMDCHAKVNPKLNECSTCHSEIGRDTIPQFRGETRIAHDAPGIWERVHGQEARMDPQFCAMCHEKEASCEDCHSRTAPQNHTIAWRNRTHGLQASWDRGSCAVCHEENFCIKCHQNATPNSHRGSWGNPINRHCVNCHYPEEQNNCVVCHERIEHDKAMPSPHSFGVFPANCAACHPGGLPHRAPHAMNSTVACIVCHQ